MAIEGYGKKARKTRATGKTKYKQRNSRKRARPTSSKRKAPTKRTRTTRSGSSGKTRAATTARSQARGISGTSRYRNQVIRDMMRGA